MLQKVVDTLLFIWRIPLFILFNTFRLLICAVVVLGWGWSTAITAWEALD